MVKLPLAASSSNRQGEAWESRSPWASPTHAQGTKHGLFQGIVWPQVLSGVVGNCVNGITNYVLVSVLGLGVR